MTLSVTIKTQFEAAVHLYDYDGACSRTHGHTYQVEITFSRLDKINDMVVDYYIAKSWVDQVIGVLDHQYLNELDAFKHINPTSENVARWLHDQITQIINDPGICIKKTSLAENNHFAVHYEPDA